MQTKEQFDKEIKEIKTLNQSIKKWEKAREEIVRFTFYLILMGIIFSFVGKYSLDDLMRYVVPVIGGILGLIVLILSVKIQKIESGRNKKWWELLETGQEDKLEFLQKMIRSLEIEEGISFMQLFPQRSKEKEN